MQGFRRVCYILEPVAVHALYDWMRVGMWTSSPETDLLLAFAGLEDFFVAGIVHLEGVESMSSIYG